MQNSCSEWVQRNCSWLFYKAHCSCISAWKVIQLFCHSILKSVNTRVGGISQFSQTSLCTNWKSFPVRRQTAVEVLLNLRNLFMVYRCCGRGRQARARSWVWEARVLPLHLCVHIALMEVGGLEQLDFSAQRWKCLYESLPHGSPALLTRLRSVWASVNTTGVCVPKGSYLRVTLSNAEGSRWDKSSESWRDSCLISSVELSQRKRGKLCSRSSYP